MIYNAMTLQHLRLSRDRNRFVNMTTYFKACGLNKNRPEGNVVQDVKYTFLQ